MVIALRVVVGAAMALFILQKFFFGIHHVPYIRLVAAYSYLSISALIPLIYWWRPLPYKNGASIAQFLLFTAYLLGNGSYTWSSYHGFRGIHWAVIWLVELYVEGAILRGRPFRPFYPLIDLWESLGKREALAAELTATKLQLERANRSLVLSAIGSSISHEIGQPLAAITVNAEAARRWLAHGNVEEAQKAISRTTQDAHRAGAVIASFRGLLKEGEAPRIPVNIGKLVKEALEIRGADIQARNIAVSAPFQWEYPGVKGDPVQLRQVFLNLIANAIDAMNEPQDAPRRLTIRCRRAGKGDVRLSVEDSGPGIQNPDRIWDLYFTSKPNGMGMGLFVSRIIVEAHGGTLTAASSQGRTIFNVTLPAEGG